MPVLPKAKDEKLAQLIARGNHTLVAACREAGYSQDSAQVTKKTGQSHIQERIAELRLMRDRVVQRVMDQEVESSAAVAKKLGITREKIIQALWFNGQRCLRGTPVLDENGVQTGQYKGRPDASGANQAFRLLGQECFNMFVEKLEIGSPGDFSRLSDDEFNEKFKEEALAAGLPEDAVVGLLEFKPPDDGTENKD
jgi:hypothetical protein